ncbi:ABC transporter permease [Bifidobacterium magnum]|uniref:ABC transporter permease n=1 Tax=Bifidobacterium magnum TaxID=1692 RepID=UPI0004119F7C|nr:ABC transporter permease [Bifidobacterium magnum]
MWRLTLTMMKKNVRMLVPAGIAVVISTMFITCSLIFGDAMSASIKDQVTAGFGNANWVMTAQDHEEDPDWQPTVGTFSLDRTRTIVDGTSEDGAQAKLAGVRADVQISARLVSGNESSNGVAISPGSNNALLPVTISEGRQPKGDNEVALPADLAQRLHISLGKHVDMEAAVAAENSNTMRDVTRQVTVVGLTEDPYGAYGYYGGAMVLSENTIAALRGKSSPNAAARSRCCALWAPAPTRSTVP